MSLNKILTISIFTILFNCSLLLNIGIPGAVVYLIATFFLVLYSIFVGNKKYTVDKKTVWALFLLLLIDKVNDYIGGGGFSQLFPLFYILFYFNFIIQIRSYKDVQDIIRKTLFIAALLLIIWGGVRSIPMRQLDRDCSIMFMVWYALYFIGKRPHRFIVSILIFILEWFIFEARTASLGLFVFWGVLLINIKNIKLQHVLIGLELFFCILLIALGVYYETFVCLGYSELFTGRGVIWGESLFYLFDSENINRFFGLSTAEVSLESAFYDLPLNSGRSVHFKELLLKGNFHNGFVYILYNTGLFGFILFIYAIIKSYTWKCGNVNNFAILCMFFVAYSFQGRSPTGIYATSILFMILMFIPISGKNENINKRFKE